MNIFLGSVHILDVSKSLFLAYFISNVKIYISAKVTSLENVTINYAQTLS